MSKKVETQQMVSQSGVTDIKIEMSHAAGFTDKLQLSPTPSRRKRRKVEHEIELEDEVTREKGVFRRFQVEGNTGDAAYASSVVVRRNVSVMVDSHYTITVTSYYQIAMGQEQHLYSHYTNM